MPKEKFPLREGLLPFASKCLKMMAHNLNKIDKKKSSQVLHLAGGLDTIVEAARDIKKIDERAKLVRDEIDANNVVNGVFDFFNTYGKKGKLK